MISAARPLSVVLTDDYQGAVSTLTCFARLANHRVTIHRDTVKDISVLAARLADAEVWLPIRGRTAVTRALLERLPKLRLISQTGMSVSHIDVEACTDHGVVVAAAGDYPHATAELTLGLMLASVRHIAHEAAQLRAGIWQTTLGTVLYGKTLGIVGYGSIGRLVAGYCKALGMRVIVWGREESRLRAEQDGVPMAASRETLFAQADVVSLHLGLNSSTRGSIGSEVLDLMKPTALLVNTARAELLAPGALISALRAGRPGYAALDVFDEEPILDPNHPLLKMDNVLCTSHLGYVEKNLYEQFFNTAIDQINAWAEGHMLNAVNPAPFRHVPE